MNLVHEQNFACSDSNNRDVLHNRNEFAYDLVLPGTFAHGWQCKAACLKTNNALGCYWHPSWWHWFPPYWVKSLCFLVTTSVGYPAYNPRNDQRRCYVFYPGGILKHRSILSWKSFNCKKFRTAIINHIINTNFLC